MPNSQKAQIERYLRTGEHDALFCAWTGESFTARIREGDLALRSALISVVDSRAGHATVPEGLVDLDVVGASTNSESAARPSPGRSPASGEG
jgi:hypothetical protein